MSDTTKIKDIISEVKTSKDWIQRRRSIISLSYEKGKELYSVFTDCLNDPIDEVKHAAIIALGRLGDKRALEELLRPKFLASPDMNIRWATVSALGKLGDHRIIADLIRQVEDEEWLVRNEVLTVLKEKIVEISEQNDIAQARILIQLLNINDSEIVNMAVDGLRKMDSDACPILMDGLQSVWEKIRYNSARTLGFIGDPTCIPHLIKALKETSPDVRMQSAIALGKIGNALAIKPLISAIGDFNENVRKSIINALVLFGKQSVDLLITELSLSQNKIVKCTAITALGAIGDERAIHTLINHLSSSYYIVRRKAIRALIQFGEEIVPHLLNLLSFNKSRITMLLNEIKNSDDVQGRIRAIKGIGSLEDNRASPLLKSLLSDPNREISLAAQNSLVKIGCAAWGRSGALAVLGEIGNSEIVPSVLKMLEDDSINVQIEAIICLDKLNDKRAIEPLIEIMNKGKTYRIRSTALRVLRKLSGGTEKLFEATLCALKDSSPDVRVQAVRTLGDFREDRVIEPLLKSLSDFSWSVRYNAENALCNQGRKVVDKLINIFQEGSNLVKKRALSALVRINDPRAIEPIENAKCEENTEMYMLIKEALKHLRGETGKNKKKLD